MRNDSSEHRGSGTFSRHSVSLVIIGWLSMVGFDFFLHGGLLASLYLAPGPFLLPLEKAFRLIPLGYIALLLLSVLIVWLMQRSGVQGWRDGLVFGLKAGALVWGASVLGLLSISTASPGLMAGWFLGQTAELGIAGGFIGARLAGVRSVRIYGLLAGFVVALLVMTVFLQSTGVVPTMRLQGGPR